MAGVFIIGLGGTGGEVIVRVKKKLKSYSRGTQVAVYYIDSKKYEHIASMNLDGGEYSLVGNVNIRNLIEQRWDDVKDWWLSQNYKPNIVPLKSGGAIQERIIGRACYFYNSGKIKGNLSSILSKKPFKDELDVFVVTSSGGGFGSSMAIDICCLVRNLTKENTKIWLVILGPSVMTGRIETSNDFKAKRIIINSVAFLTELDFYMQGKHPYEFKIFDGSSIRYKGKPCDGVFLIQLDNEDGANMQDVSDYYDLIADGIWHLTELSLSTAGQGKTGLENIIGYLITVSPDKKNCVQNYASFGVTEIRCPVNKIEKYLLSWYMVHFLNSFFNPITEKKKETLYGMVDKLFHKYAIVESGEQSELQRKFREILEKKGFPKWDSNLIEQLRTELTQSMTQENIKTTLRRYSKNLHAALDNTPIIGQNDKKKWFNEIDNTMKDMLIKGEWQAVQYWLNALIKKLENQKSVLEQMKRNELDKKDENKINADINRKLNSVLEKLSKKPKIFRKSDWKKECELRIQDLTLTWVKSYFRFYFLSAFIPRAIAFINESTDFIKNKLNTINILNTDMETKKTEWMKVQRAIELRTRVDIPAYQPDTDYIIDICATKSIVENIFGNQLKKKSHQHRDFFLRKISLYYGWISPKSHEQSEEKSEPVPKNMEEIWNILTELLNTHIRQILPADLDEAIELEARYFWKESKEVTIFEALKKGDIDLIQKIKEDLGRCYGEETLNDIFINFERKSYDEKTVLDKLFKGRLKQIKKYTTVFWNRSVISDHATAEEARFKIFFLQNEGINQRIYNYVNNLWYGHENIHRFDHPRLDPRSLLFFYMDAGAPLHLLEGIGDGDIKSIEDSDVRRKTYPSPNVRELEPGRIGHADRRFLWEPPYQYHSILPEHRLYEIDIEKKAYLVFALGEMFNYIAPSVREHPDGQKKRKTRQNFRLQKTIGKYQAQLILGKSLKDALDFLKKEKDLCDQLYEKVDSDFRSQYYAESTRTGLRKKLKDHIRFYNKAKEKSNPEIYERFIELLYEYAAEVGFRNDEIT